MKSFAAKFIKACCLIACLQLVAWAEPVETVLNNGPASNRVDIAILGDGYTSNELQKYRTDAQTMIQRFFEEEPFKEYQSLFNVHRIDVISNQSGADHGGQTVDTALGAAYNCSGIDRLICVDSDAVNAIRARSLTPAQYDITIILVNDTTYGGSGGLFAVASLHPQVVELVLHELAHSFGGLGDEYGGTAGCNFLFEPSVPNVTRATQRSQIKWKHWIDAGTPVPTNSNIEGVPGSYLGASLCDNEMYRPTFNSKMRTLGKPYDDVNVEQLIKRMYDVVSPIDSSQPAGPSLTMTLGQSQLFKIAAVANVHNSIEISWYLDGQLQSPGSEFNFNATAANAGAHVVEAVVKDSTPRVRNDPDSLLTESRKWNLTLNAPAANTVQLSASSYSINESGGSLQVVVSRTDTAQAATVDFATNDNAELVDCTQLTGFSTARCDYAATLGTLRFAVGEASKSIFIPIVDDSYAEGSENFTVALSHASGATLGTPSSATVTITDNETANGPNPIDAVDFFIRQQYIDFLGREPDPAGLQGWRNVLNNCGTTVQPPCDRIEVSAGFFRSEEFQSRGYFIYRFYSAVGKIPVSNEFIPDFARVSGFLSAEQLEANKVAFINEFMTRLDFQNKYASTLNNPTAFVDALLQTVNLPGHPGRASWISMLNANNNSQTRAQVVRELVESSEVYNKYYNEAFVIMQYFGYLRRTADASYLNWIQTMNQSNGDYRIMINGFLNSAEYRKRFGP
jgi:IgA Peptidase M64/Calx-beta domain/Domain of unknown function (DUF4214)